VWKRDFKGASGLFGVVFQPAVARAINSMIDQLELFGISFSWGGYESLMVPSHPDRSRTATNWPTEFPCVRVHAGLEDIDDLIADLKQPLDS
jgi:cystathionine beta-lyase